MHCEEGDHTKCLPLRVCNHCLGVRRKIRQVIPVSFADRPPISQRKGLGMTEEGSGVREQGEDRREPD